MAGEQGVAKPTRKKPSYPVSPGLRAYLTRWRREKALRVTYDSLRGFADSVPVQDAEQKDTLWESVVYDHREVAKLAVELKQIYADLRTDGDVSVLQHVYVDRVDFCTFGNSLPFRVRMLNMFNDNPDYFYIKRADASRVYGLELEHLLSPTRLNYLTCGDTLVEDHIAGLPGDVFIDRWLKNPELSPVRIAKELVKFDERCFVRLLGDMRSYNFVVVLTPDFEGMQVRIRAMDFDQQSYDGRKNFYLPRYYKENLALSQFCQQQLRPETAAQYQREEQTMILQRAAIVSYRVAELVRVMARDTLSTPEKITQLRESLAQHFQRKEYLNCETMGELVRENLESIRLAIGRPEHPRLGFGGTKR